MSEHEKNYSDYISWMESQRGMYGFICGFTFTILTLLVIYLPKETASTLVAQLILFFLTILFDLLLFLISLMGSESLQFCKNIPPYNKITQRLCYNLATIVFMLWGFSIPLIYVLFELYYLAVVSAIIWLLLMILSIFIVSRPLEKYRGITKIKGDTE